MKKLLAFTIIIIAVVSIILSFSVNAYAASGKCGDYLTYSLSGNKLTISGNGSMYNWESDYYVPWNDYSDDIFEIIIGDKVTSIGNYAFSRCENLEYVVIGDSVKQIGNYAFSTCYNLKSITIPRNVTTIGDEAFSSCFNLLNIYLTNGLETIGNRAFSSCSSIEKISIPDSVTSIGDRLFEDCYYLNNLSIGSGLKTMGIYMFDNCSRHTDISVSPLNDYYSSENGVLFNKDMSELLIYPQGRPKETYTIPHSVTTLADNSFYNCKYLKYITIDNIVKNIGNKTFYKCESLLNVNMGNSVNTIGINSFSNCYNLKNIVLGNNLKTIGNEAFAHCNNLEKIIIPDSVTSMGNKTFYGCSKLQKIIISNNITYIGEIVFGDCVALNCVFIGKNTEKVSADAFWGCSSLNDIWYNGSSEEWKTIQKGTGNYSLPDEANHYKVNYSFVTNCDEAIEPMYSLFLINEPQMQDYNTVSTLWYDNKDFNGNYITFPYRSETDIVLYAKKINHNDILYSLSGNAEKISETEYAFNVTVTSSAPMTQSLILALYDKDGTLIKSELINATSSSNGEQVIHTVYTISEAGSYRIMLWDSASLQPLYNDLYDSFQ